MSYFTFWNQKGEVRKKFECFSLEANTLKYAIVSAFLGKSHSCETQLATVIDDWTKELDNQCQVDTFILDFESFDSPPHELIKNKLASYGIGGRLLNGLMLSFATDNKKLWLMM